MNPVTRSALVFGVALAFAFDASSLSAAETKTIVTSVVSAAIDKSYRREKNPDGSFKTEYYLLQYGGQAKGTISDKSIDFVRVAEFETLVKEQLAKQNYVMAPDAASASLLIHLLWGMTDPPTDKGNLNIARTYAAQSYAKAAAARRAGNVAGGGWGSPKTGVFGDPNSTVAAAREAESEAESDLMYMLLLEQDRERSLEPTARLLGYIDPINDLTGNPAVYAGLEASYSELWEEIGERRYYVIVCAYDLELLWQHKKAKPLWVTRVSITAKDNRFDEQVAAMLARASSHFGRRTRGLVREFRAKVKIGETEVIGVVDDEPERPASPSDDAELPANPPPPPAQPSDAP